MECLVDMAPSGVPSQKKTDTGHPKIKNACVHKCCFVCGSNVFAHIHTHTRYKYIYTYNNIYYIYYINIYVYINNIYLFSPGGNANHCKWEMTHALQTHEHHWHCNGPCNGPVAMPITAWERQEPCIANAWASLALQRASCNANHCMRKTRTMLCKCTSITVTRLRTRETCECCILPTLASDWSECARCAHLGSAG